MRVQLVCLEDGITSCGFRKLAAYAAQLQPGSESCYVSTRSYRTIRAAVSGTMGTLPSLLDRDQVDEIAQGLRHADLLGFSSMTGYAGLTRSVIQRVRELSGGEIQRVALARALAFDPPVILADEPTGNLDSRNGAAVLSLLRGFSADAGCTVVMVTHSEEAAAYGARRIYLRDGAIEKDLP